MGAWELLKWLDGDERAAFRDQALEAIVNTAERDRLVAWDPEDGLYRGEQSFLDWREQTYPQWTANDTAQIGMSKALGTNIGHLAMLEVASKLAVDTIRGFLGRVAGGEATMPTLPESRLGRQANLLKMAVRLAHDEVMRATETEDGRIRIEDKTSRVLLPQVADPLQLGETADPYFLLGHHWLSHF